MLRFLAILLFFGLAIASGAAGYFAHIQKQDETVEPEAPVDFEPVTAFDMIDDTPKEDKAVQLTEFFFGRLPIGINLDDNKKDWEEVYIPLFPRTDQIQKHNAVCVIYQTNEITTQEQASEFFEQLELEAFYTLSQQELPDYAFSELAQKYKSLDYSKCILLTNQAPQAVKEETTYWAALCGFAFFLSIAGWQSFAFLGDMKSRIEREKSAHEVRDAAGLSSLFEAVDEKNGVTPQAESSESTTGQSFIEKWTPEE